MQQALAVALGAAIGGLCRWGLSHLFAPVSQGFPWGILAVNLLGSLLIGVCFGHFSHGRSPEVWGIFWMVGVLGGFTTFSTFSLDLLKLVATGKWGLALGYVLISCVGGLILAAAGAWMTGGLQKV